MKNALIALSVVLLSLSVVKGFGHEGHEHDLPKTLSAPRGGDIRALYEGFVEVVSKGHELKIFVYDKDLKPYQTKDIQLQAKTVLPRVKGANSLNVAAKENFFEGMFDAKGAHRYTLLLSIKRISDSKPTELRFTVEPRK
jgi:hypothetical protein